MAILTRHQAEDAILDLVSDGALRLTAGDVVGRGCATDLGQARALLQGLLASGAGSIDPTPAGVVYVLHADARDRVRQRRLRARCTSGLVRIASYAWYALRVSFGVCLFLSIVIAAVIIIAVWIAKCTQDGADRDRFHHHHHGFDDFFPGFDRMAWWYLLQPPVFVPSPSRGHQYRRVPPRPRAGTVRQWHVHVEP